MRITCVGGGPAGLMFAILASKAGHEVRVLEQCAPAESFGWGIVFGKSLLRELDAHDPETAGLLRRDAYVWQDQVVAVGAGSQARVPSSGYSMRRRLLLEHLRARAQAVGVRIESKRFSGDPTAVGDADLVIASDGVNSTIRQRYPAFRTHVVQRRNKYIWLGTDKEFASFTFPFVQTPAGWVWAHAYGFDSGASTFIVETAPQTWSGLGFDTMTNDQATRRLEQIFEAALQGHRLFAQPGRRADAAWNNFPVVQNKQWYVGNVALMGDAAHTTHFTIGSGTRLAMEDAMVLAEGLAAEPGLDAALAYYQRTRQKQLHQAQREATRSAHWFERVPRYIGQPPHEFAYLLDTRRSPVMHYLPVSAYLAFTRATDKFPAIQEPIRRVISKL